MVATGGSADIGLTGGEEMLRRSLYSKGSKLSTKAQGARFFGRPRSNVALEEKKKTPSAWGGTRRPVHQVRLCARSAGGG